MKNLSNGFYTALGTPLNEKGELIGDSLIREINIQIDAGASGLLLMGSMGIEASVPDKAYEEAVKITCKTVDSRVPVFVGAMDNSVQRVVERIDKIKEYDFDYVVVTTPFYFSSEPDTLCNFFEMIADRSDKPLFLYDLPGVTKCKITFSMVQRLSMHKNIKGIKSGDLILARLIKRNIPGFEVLYSNIDSFDAAISFGICKVLDGMFCATPQNAMNFTDNAFSGNLEKSSQYLDNILLLRDTYVKYGVMQSFTHSMNILGMDGNFAPDYFGFVCDDGKTAVEKVMKDIGEIYGR